MSTNPYLAPRKPCAADVETASHVTGRNCPSCGGTNTGRDVLLRRRPSVLYVLFFGWIFLLIRGAFAVRTDWCRDCGTMIRYKSAGSWVALALLILLLLLIVAAMTIDSDAWN